MRKFMIERDIPKVGTLEREELGKAAAKSNQALRQLGPDIQWLESFVTAEKTFCVYMAKDESIIHRHLALTRVLTARPVPYSHADVALKLPRLAPHRTHLHRLLRTPEPQIREL